MERHSFHVVEHSQQMSLDGMRVAGLSQDFQQGGVGHEEETWEHKSFLFKVAMRYQKWNAFNINILS